MVLQPRRSLALFAILLGAGAASTGCGLTPKSQLDECRQRGQALRTENDRLKDQVLTLRSENQEIAQRSVDDERRLEAQEDAIAHLEETAQGYQDDRDRLTALYERLKGQVQASAGPEARARSGDDLLRFAQEHPGATFDGSAGVVTIPVETLFRPGTATLRPEADGLLKALAGALAGADAAPRTIVLSVPSDDEALQRVSHTEPADEPARFRFLAMARASQVRERLAQTSKLDAKRIQIADPDRVKGGPNTATANAPAADGPLEIRLVHAPTAAASGP